MGAYFVGDAVVTGLTHRQSEILNIARAFGRVMVEDLARRFEVSAQTIRKDLNDLCDHRSLTRIHGGAIIASGVENLAYEARRFVAADEKKAIGAAAAALIPNGCSLFINIGTTTEEVASALTSHEDLLVITNNLNVAMLLYRHPRIEVIVAGGAVRRADGAVIGSTAISLIGQFKVDYAIIGASAIDEEGALLDFDYREVQAAQAIIANARSVMLVADFDKTAAQRPGAHRPYQPDPDLRHRRGAAGRAAEYLPQPRHRGDRGDAEIARRSRRARPGASCRRDALALVPFSVAFVLGCDLIQTESEIAKVNRRTPGERLWTKSTTWLSLAAASMAAASHAMRRVGAILFFYVK